jgi:hypothetical protein
MCPGDRTTAERWQLSASGFQPEVSGVTSDARQAAERRQVANDAIGAIEKVKL